MRRQFKSSLDSGRPISLDDFVEERSSLRIDRLVLTHVRDNGSGADEYRLCATWRPPADADLLARALVTFAGTPTFAGCASSMYKISADAVWPKDSGPVWEPLNYHSKPGATFSRDDFVTFCERFVVELCLPKASSKLSIPGPMERELVQELSDGVGIGRYPNINRKCQDVAALAIGLATLARAQSLTLMPGEIERELDIRTDYGRVPQSFPLDESLYLDRPAFRELLKRTALSGEHQLVTGPPGSGKSWELTRLVDDLRRAGAIVARHYCYLEPGDQLVESRVMADVFFGNIIGELVDAAPEILATMATRYSAGPSELESILAEAAVSGRRVVLVVDGLDHIARVMSGSHHLSKEDTDIAERIAGLNIPDGIALVIGSQPGEHLDAIASRWDGSISKRNIPDWSPTDIEALLNLHGVGVALSQAGVGSTDGVHRIGLLVAERAGGNPLYARYLARGLVEGLRIGSVTDPVEWVSNAPEISGDLARYYSHIYGSADRSGQAVADLLGLLDFAVTEDELRELMPPISRRFVRRALEQFAPVLASAHGQGGVRVYHESFRRFMNEEMSKQGGNLGDALEPVVDWLRGRGFYQDARAYRFLLPLLRRSAKVLDVVDQVDTSFLSESVAHAHPLEAIQRNLALAADAASHLMNWPALVRFIELHRAAYACFDENRFSWTPYWSAFLELSGPESLSERLLFEGRPTHRGAGGLVACSMIDDAGAVAPWEEYLGLCKDSAEEAAAASNLLPHHALSLGRSNRWEGDRGEWNRYSLAGIHGLLRLGYRSVVYNSLVSYLREAGRRFDTAYVRMVSNRMSRMLGPARMQARLLRNASRSGASARVHPRAMAVILLGVADEHRRSGNDAAAACAATLALESADSADLIVECMLHGASSRRGTDRDLALSEFRIGLEPGAHGVDPSQLRAWIASVRLACADSNRRARTLKAERSRMNGTGWYRSWLRYTLGLAETESKRRTGEPTDILSAFEELTRDVDPFLGTPRPCDLYSIEPLIQETLSWGLSLLRSPGEWEAALDAISVAAEGTASRMDKEDGGPVSFQRLIDLLVPHAANSSWGATVRNAIEFHVNRAKAVSTYYSEHSELEMKLARTRCLAGDRAGAAVAWKQAATYFTGYGHHKDVSLFEFIDTIPSFSAASPTSALRALTQIQPLVDSAVSHTDQRETKHAPNLWMRVLLGAEAATGMEVIARTALDNGGGFGWVLSRGIQDAIAVVVESADPVLAFHVTAMLPVHDGDGGSSIALGRLWLQLVRRASETDKELAKEAFRRVSLDLQAAGLSADARLSEELLQVGEALGVCSQKPASEPLPEHTPQAEPPGLNSVPPAGEEPSELSQPLPRNPTFSDLLSRLRAAGKSLRWEDDASWRQLAHQFAPHVLHLVDSGRQEDALRLLRHFSRHVEVKLSQGDHPIAVLASALSGAGHCAIAASAHALAVTGRSMAGHLRLGGKLKRHQLALGMGLDGAMAKQTIAEEIAYALGGPCHLEGATRFVMDFLSLSEPPGHAQAAWTCGFDVMKTRLPLPPERGWFVHLETCGQDAWTVDESLIALLLAGLADPRLDYKHDALAGVASAIRRKPEAVTRPLSWWFGRNGDVTSALLVLDALWGAEAPPYVVSQRVSGWLAELGSGPSWGPMQMSRQLLRRAGVASGNTRTCGLRRAAECDGSVPSEDRVRLWKWADTGGVLDQLEAVWPGLSLRLVGRIDSAKDDPDNQERMRDTTLMAFGRDGSAFPPTPVLLWQSELFETALHEELSELTSVERQGRPLTPGETNWLAGLVLPRTHFHLGLAASACARPNWPRPKSLANGKASVPVLGNDIAEYAGWRRLGRVEMEYVGGRQGSGPLPPEVITAFSGTIATHRAFELPAGSLPFREAPVDDWSLLPADPAGPSQFRQGPVVGMFHRKHWLGDVLSLVPPLECHALHRLIPPQYGEPLVWRNREGAAELVLRAWRVCKMDTVGNRIVELDGCDLIVSPSLFRDLSSLAQHPLFEFQVVVRRPP